VARSRKLDVGREELESMYQTHSMKQIAKHYGVGETLVWNRIHEFDIKLTGYESSPRRRPKQFSPEHKAAIVAAGIARRGKWLGENNPNWRGGRTDANLALRRTGAYKQWKLSSLARAGNKCEQCGIIKGHVCECCGHKAALHVHHVKSFANHEELRFDPANSEVLCTKCHHSRHFGKIG
jgi:5-methylcytosine-specific restriction endonuclease McrA